MENPQHSLAGRILFVTAASVVGTEFLTGSTPMLPPAFLSPNLLILACLYGTGVLLVREVSVIFKKGWLSILAFGAAYAVVEEGIFEKTLFDASPLNYGQWGGVNWSFGIAETIVESMFSITIPIALSRITYPKSEEQRWFSNQGFGHVCLLHAVVVTMGFFASFRNYAQPVTQIPLALFMIAALISIGSMIGSPRDQTPLQGKIASPRVLTVAFFIFTVALFLLAPLWMDPKAPRHISPIPVDTAAVILLILAFRFLHRSRLSNQQLFGAIVGIASVMILMTIVGPQRLLGAPLGGILYVALLAFSWRRMKAIAIAEAGSDQKMTNQPSRQT